MIKRTTNGHYGCGLVYNPHTLPSYKRAHALDKLNEVVALCDKMLKRQKKKLRPNVKEVLRWGEKRNRAMHEIYRLNRLG